MEDVGPLARHFMERFDATGRRELSSEAQWVLGEYAWPGNVQELEDCIEAMLTRSASAELEATDLAPALVERFKELSSTDAIPSRASSSVPGGAQPSKADRLKEEFSKLEVGPERPTLEGYERLWPPARAARHAR